MSTDHVYERSKEERIRNVIETAKQNFVRSGYSATTTAQIAREAGISEITLFRYFATKRELFEAVIKPLTQFEWFPSLEPGSTTLNPDSVLKLLKERVVFAKQERALVKMAIVESQLQPDLAGAYNPVAKVSSQLKFYLQAFGIDEQASKTVVHLIMALILAIAFTPFYDERIINTLAETVELEIIKILKQTAGSGLSGELSEQEIAAKFYPDVAGVSRISG